MGDQAKTSRRRTHADPQQNIERKLVLEGRKGTQFVAVEGQGAEDKRTAAWDVGERGDDIQVEEEIGGEEKQG